MSRKPKMVAKQRRSKLTGAKVTRTKAKPSGKSGVTKAYVTSLVRELREEVARTFARQSDLQKLSNELDIRIVNQAGDLTAALLKQGDAISALRAEFVRASAAEAKAAFGAKASSAETKTEFERRASPAETKATSAIEAKVMSAIAEQATALVKIKEELEQKIADARSIARSRINDIEDKLKTIDFLNYNYEDDVKKKDVERDSGTRKSLAGKIADEGVTGPALPGSFESS
jgi:hypothetical protein